MKANNQEAKSLILESKELLDQADNELHENDAKACENIAKYAQLREEIIEKSIKHFYNTYQKIKNCTFEGADISYIEDNLEDIKENFYSKAPKIEPLDISQVKTAGFSSFIMGIIYSVITLAILLAIGIAKSGTMIYLDVIPTLDMYKPILDFYGNIVAPNRGTAMMGLAFIAGTSVTVGLILAMLRYHGRSNKNLQTAQKTLEIAKEHKAEKDTQNNKILALCEYTHKVDTSIYSLNIYLEEYYAIMKRILHVEGDNYNKYSPISRQKIQTGVILYNTIQKVMNTNIVSEDAEVNPESHHELSLAKHYLEAIKHSELGNYDDTVYEEVEEIEDDIYENSDEDMLVQEEVESIETEEENIISEDEELVQENQEEVIEEAKEELSAEETQEDKKEVQH